ncbi:MAG: hypothetical protein JXR96_22305 [Deltaproteobacteria bacterium]|nr:hypothetical protein [Deltaproteobacteria bacterium]
MRGRVLGELALLAVLATLAGCSGSDYECIYDTDCAGGQICRNGACVDPAGPCDGVACDQPPGDATCYQLPGECLSGRCSYAALADGTACESVDPCAMDGICEQGRCLGDPIVCSMPPEATCADETTLRIYVSTGRCVDGGCVYDYNEVTCAQGCEAGYCVGDPCAGVTCDSPPEPGVCYLVPGRCSSGACSYDYNDGHICDDGDPCRVQDSCRQGVCAGVPMQCTSPPANACDGNTAVIYDSRGTCSGGQCEYGSQRVDCGAEGCADGRCVGDPCAGVSCTSPPNDQCYEAAGACVETPDVHCEYTPLPDDTDCDDGDSCTLGDVCTDGDCGGAPMQCTSPPDNDCQDETILIVYAGNGSCADGQCSYGSSEVDCGQDGCLEQAGDDACGTDPCAGVTCDDPPDPTCANATTRRWWDGGRCVSGTCEYDHHDQSCTYGCTAGQCNADPCQGVTCNDPPANRCEDASTLRQYDASGTCSGGECAYGSHLVSCDHGCDNGRCNDCVPDTCGANNCGSMPDGCGGTLHCGGCSDSQEDCESNVCVCNHEECGGDCCAAGQVCNPGNACCTPITCGADRCGSMMNGCGSSMNCGGCSDPQEDCESTYCVCNNAECSGDCCAAGQVCYSGACCTPSCSGRCGGASNGCGGQCGLDCPSGEYCDGAGYCQDCDVAQHCGPSCVDCSDNDSGHACVGGACGCNSGGDCPAGLTCHTSTHLCGPSAESNCHDGADNDNDGRTDCEDGDCLGRMCDLSAYSGSTCYGLTCRECDTFTCTHSKDPRLPPECPDGCGFCSVENTCLGP